MQPVSSRAMPKRKFIPTPSEETIHAYREKQHSKRTNYSTVSAENALREYYGSLPQSSSSPDYRELSASNMNKLLEKFYLSCRTVSGEEYKASSLRAMSHSLCRAIKSSHKFDILKDSDFSSSNSVLANKLRDLKQAGLGSVDHYPDLSATDLRKVVDKLSPNQPDELQLLVWFYLQLHFCKRGMENIPEMEKDHYCVTYVDGKRCLVQAKDEMTKNHRENDQTRVSGAVVPEQGHPKCPVILYEKYLSKLDPESKFLWQSPLKNQEITENGIWYKRKSGKNAISKFMKKISTKCELSKVI